MDKKNDVGFIVPFAVFLGGIGGGIVFPILPILGLKFTLSAFFIGVILSANKFARIFINQFVGIAIDLFGGKKPLILGLIIESIGSLLYVASIYAPYHGSLMLLGRLIWGAGSAFLFISANTVALNMSMRSTRGQSTAKVRIALSLGVPFGLVLGGVLSSLFSDTIAFLSSSIASFLGAILVLLFFKETVKPSFRTHIGIRESFQFMLKNKLFGIIGAGNLLTFFSLQGVVMATLVLFIQEKHLHFIYPDPKFSSGVIMSFMMISSGISGILAGRIVDRLKVRSILGVMASVIVLIGFLILSFTATTAVLIFALIVLGVAIGANNITLLSILGDFSSLENRGKAVSVYQLLGDIGGTLGPIFGIQLGLKYSFSSMYLLTGLIFSLNILVFLILKKKERTALK